MIGDSKFTRMVFIHATKMYHFSPQNPFLKVRETTIVTLPLNCPNNNKEQCFQKWRFGVKVAVLASDLLRVAPKKSHNFDTFT